VVPEQSDDAAPARAWPNFVRLSIGAVGLAGFVLGAIIAFRSGGATTLLVVSGVMVVLAALGLEWSKIRGTYGPWAIELLRGVENQIEQTRSLVATAEIATPSRALKEVVERLDSLGEQVKALAPSQRARRSASTATSSAGISEMVRELFTTKATHSFKGRDSVTLKLHIASDAASFTCTLKTPNETVYSAVTRRPINLGIVIAGVNDYSVTYPEDFSGAEPLLPGRYLVEWRPTPGASASDPFALAIAASGAVPPAATDSFTIPG